MEKKSREKYNDLTGQVFGWLTAIRPTNQRLGGCIVWECECKCKTICYVSSRYLVRGYRKSCGCMKKDKSDLRNREFGLLKAIEVTRVVNGRQMWLCQCKCGNLCEVSGNNLLSNHTKSCGCAKNTEQLRCIEGTSLSLIASKKIAKNNTSGVKGVSRQKGRWVANINFKGKHYFLGSYEDIQDAIKARKEAEELYFEPFIRKYAAT